jgi:hypothetical protein
MSVWTHANLSFRLDAFRSIGKVIDESDIEKYINENVPEGSEGPMQCIVWENPRKECVFSYVVNIFGDLRGFESEEVVEIEQFMNDFVKFLDKNAIMIRDAVGFVDAGDATHTYTYTYDHEIDGFVKTALIKDWAKKEEEK